MYNTQQDDANVSYQVDINLSVKVTANDIEAAHFRHELLHYILHVRLAEVLGYDVVDVDSISVKEIKTS